MEENTQEDLTTLDTVNEVPAVPKRKKLGKKIITVKLNNNMLEELSVTVKDSVDISKVEQIIKDIRDKSYTPTAKDKLYFYPECTVPRFKVREYWGPKKVSITIKENNGTHKFFSSNLDKYLDKTSTYEIEGNVLKRWFNINDTLFSNHNEQLMYKNLSEDLKSAIDNNDTIYIDYSFRSAIRGISSNFTSADHTRYRIYSIPDAHIGYAYIHKFSEEKIANAFEEALNDNSIFYVDETINRALQNESTVIDGDMYTQLVSLFKSEDENNHTMAMEVMANSNIEKSAKFIYKLMEAFCIKSMFNNKAYNSVNFRALRDTTGLDRYITYDENSYIRFLQKYDQVDMEAVATIRERCINRAEEVIKSLYRDCINDEVLTLEIPYVKVILKGVNDGTEEIIDYEINAIEAAVETNPKQFVDQLPELVAPEVESEEVADEHVTPPCAAHDEATVEALKEEVAQEEVEAKAEDTPELIEGVNDALEDITIMDVDPMPEDQEDREMMEAGREMLDADMVMQEIKTEEAIAEREKEDMANAFLDEMSEEYSEEELNTESQAIESVVKPVVEAITPENDDPFAEDLTFSDEDPFA